MTPVSTSWFRPPLESAIGRRAYRDILLGMGIIVLFFGGFGSWMALAPIASAVPVNAHTTASDALWAGIPVVTLSGETFISRVAGSLLNATGLPELITNTLDNYIQCARELARDPAPIQGYKDRLVTQRASLALFDTERNYILATNGSQRGNTPGSTPLPD